MSGNQWYTLKVCLDVCHVRESVVHPQGMSGRLSCPGISGTPSRYVWTSVMSGNQWYTLKVCLDVCHVRESGGLSVTPEKMFNFLKEINIFGNI